MHVDEYVAEYNGCRMRGAQAKLDRAMVILKANEGLNPEEKAELQKKLNMRDLKYSRELTIARCEWLRTRVAELPDKGSTLYELATLNGQDSKDFIASGLLSPNLRRKTVEDWKRERRDGARNPESPPTSSQRDAEHSSSIPVEHVETSSDEALSPPSLPRTGPGGENTPPAGKHPAPNPGASVHGEADGAQEEGPDDGAAPSRENSARAAAMTKRCEDDTRRANKGSPKAGISHEEKRGRASSPEDESAESPNSEGGSIPEVANGPQNGGGSQDQDGRNDMLGTPDGRPDPEKPARPDAVSVPSREYAATSAGNPERRQKPSPTPEPRPRLTPYLTLFLDRELSPEELDKLDELLGPVLAYPGVRGIRPDDERRLAA